VSDEYFFDHLQDDIAEDIAEDYPVEVKGLSTSNAFDGKSNNTYVDPVRNVIGFSKDEQPEQSIYESLANNNVFDNPVCNFLAASNEDVPQQCIEISTPDVPMNLRKSPPEQMIHQSTAPNTSLTFDLQQSSSSEESDTESQFDAKYKAHMRALGHPLCNWQFENCFLSNRPAMHCQFTNRCSNFAHKRCSILWSRTHGWNVDSVETIGRFCREHYMYYDKEVLPSQTNNGTDCIWAWPNTERDHEWPEDDVMEFTANGLWFAPDCEKCFRTNKYLTHGDKICGHSWQPHRLDKTGDYILFPSLCWHKGFYHDEFNKTFI